MFIADYHHLQYYGAKTSCFKVKPLSKDQGFKDMSTHTFLTCILRLQNLKRQLVWLYILQTSTSIF